MKFIALMALLVVCKPLLFYFWCKIEPDVVLYYPDVGIKQYFLITTIESN